MRAIKVGKACLSDRDRQQALVIPDLILLATDSLDVVLLGLDLRGRLFGVTLHFDWEKNVFILT